jgi:hypothetical protein
MQSSLPASTDAGTTDPLSAASAPIVATGPSGPAQSDPPQIAPGQARDTGTDAPATQPAFAPPQPAAPIQSGVTRPEPADPPARAEGAETLQTPPAIAINADRNDAGGVGSVPIVTSNTATSSTPASHPPPSAASSPAAQAMPALIALAGTRTSQSIKLTLDPGSLGKLDIRIERSVDAVNVQLTAEKPETAALLARDQSELHKVLDQAGLPADGRSITFHVAAPDIALSGATPSRNGMDHPVATPHADASVSANTGGTGGDSSLLGQHHPARRGRPKAASEAAQADKGALPASVSATSAIDITA